MDIETVFLCCFKIEEKPSDIFCLIEAALQVGASKYPALFQKRKTRIINFLMDPSTTSDDSILGVDDDEQVIDDSVGDEDQVTNDEESEKQKESGVGLKKTSETDLVVQQLDAADKQGTPPRKKMSLNVSTKRVQVAPPRVKQLSDSSSFKKQLEEGKQLKKQSDKGHFKKMERDAEKKREEGSQECTGGLTKSMPPPLMKMNVATKPLEVAPQKQVVSDCSPQKQSNCSEITRPMQKETESISHMKKFESSKRKFEERLAEQKEAKGRIVMVDFHHMLNLLMTLVLPNAAGIGGGVDNLMIQSVL